MSTLISCLVGAVAQCERLVDSSLRCGPVADGGLTICTGRICRMFRELGVRYPILETEAKLIVSRQITREVIEGGRNAWAAANHLEISIWGWRGACLTRFS